MRRVRATNPKELSRSAKFYSLLTLPDLFLVFFTMMLSSLLTTSPMRYTTVALLLIAIRKFINRRHNVDFVDSKLRNKDKLLWFDQFGKIKKG